MNRWLTYLFSTPALLMIACFALLPTLLLFRVSLYLPSTGRGFYVPDTFTLENYLALADLAELQIIFFTACFGLTVASLVIIVGLPLVLFVRSLPSRLQVIALLMILIPKTAGLLATLFGLQRMLPRGTVAAIIGEVYLILPYAVLVMYNQQRTIRPELLSAAEGLGGTKWQIFRRVTLPLSFPGIVIAFELGLIWGLAAFLGPLFLGGPMQTTLSVELHRQAFEYGRWPRAAAIAVCLLAQLSLAVFAIGRIFRRPGGMK